MKNDCSKCEMNRIFEESLSDKGPVEINSNLMADLFDLVFVVYRVARGTRDTVGSDRYINRDRILEVVNAAIDKAEMEALDEWRANQLHRQ